MHTNITSKNAPVITLVASVLLYIVVFVILTLWKYNHFYYDNLDLAIFNQAFFNTLHGMPFAATIHPPTYLADHFSPIMYLLLPLYALLPGPQILLFLQTLIIGLTAIPIYLIARHLLSTRSTWLPTLIALLWLANPLVHNMNFFEFELTGLAVFLLFWTIYFYLKEQPYPFMIMSTLALLVREDVALIILFIGLLAWIEKRSWFWRLFPIAGAILYSLMSFSVIASFAPTDSYKFLIYYGWLGGTTLPTIAASFFLHPLKLITHLFTWKNLEFILGLTFPFFFLVITKNKYLILLIPPLSQVLLSGQGGSALILMTHYGGYLLLSLFLVFIVQLKNIEQGTWPQIVPMLFRHRKLLYLTIIGASLYGVFTYGSITPALAAWATNNQEQEKLRIVSMIPETASVASTFELLTPLSSRRTIASLHYALVGKNQFALTDYNLPENTEYLVIDWQDVLKAQMHFSEHHAFGPYADQVPQKLRSILQQFDLIYANGSLAVMKKSANRGNTLTRLLLREASASFSESADPTIQQVQTGEEALAITLSLPRVSDIGKNYYLSVKTSRRTFLLPLSYGINPPSEWRDNAILTMWVYLGSSEQQDTTIELFAWNKGFLKLGQLKNLEMVSDATVIDTYSTAR